MNFTFSPANVTITQGDTVIFQIAGAHNAVEVSQTTWNANQNTALGGGFSLGFGGGTVGQAFLTVGTHYYVCQPHAGMGMKGMITVLPPPVNLPNVWINEIHYDNIGTDALEGFEIAGVAGTNLACLKVALYTGNNGTVYNTVSLTGTIDDEGCGYGAVWFGLPTDGMQNGPDGMVLFYSPSSCGSSGNDTLIQALSYEGTFLGTAGIANGVNFTNIGVQENSNTANGRSLQLGGIGTNYAAFTWASPATNSYDVLNPNQYPCGAPVVSFSIVSCSGVQNTVGEAAGSLTACNYVKAVNLFSGPHTVDLVLKTGNANDIANYTTQTFTFSGTGSDSSLINISITDDAVFEGDETLVMALRSPSSGNVVGVDSLLTFTIIDNDVAVNPIINFTNTSTTVTEADGSINIPVSVLNPNANSISVDYVLSSSTATPGTDFTFTAGTLTFPAGSSAAINIPATIVDDLINEGVEDFSIVLQNPTGGAVIGDGTTIITITDNDNLVIQFASASSFVNEGDGTVQLKVVMNKKSIGPISVTIGLGAGTATTGSDFNFTPATITFPPMNNDTISINVSIIDDTTPEVDETIIINLSSPTNGATLGTPSTYTYTIRENDGFGFEESDLNASSFVIFPNPASEFISLKGIEKANYIEIRNVLGQLVYSSKTMSEGITNLSIGQLSQGTYILNIHFENNIISKKFIKN